MKKEPSEVEQSAQYIVHPFVPFYDENSSVLIVGSFPSVASRAEGFYYGNVHNRFWKVLEAIFEEDCRATVEQSRNQHCDVYVANMCNNGTKIMTISEKKTFLVRHKIAIYDAICECTISGSSDSSIRDVVPSDIESIVKNSKVKKIFANGKTAAKFFEKYQKDELCKMLEVLPSTSPANASFSLEKLVEAWKVVAE